MRRLFISLYLSIAAALLIFIFAIPYLVERGLQGPLLNTVSSFAESPRRVLEKEFADIPLEQWPAHVAMLQSKFGYDISLFKLDDIEEEESVLKRLRRGDVSIAPSYEEDTVLLPMLDTDFAIKVSFGMNIDEQGSRSSQGFFYLIEKHTASASADERQAYYSELDALNGVPINERPLSDLNLNPTERQRLEDGLIVSRDIDNDDETYIKKINGSDQAYVIGPVVASAFPENLDLIALAVLGLLFGATVFLWLRPLIRDMHALDNGAAAFGDGHLDARVSVGKRSSIRELTSTFNSMADRIKALISSQKELTDSVSHELRTPISRLRFGLFRLENSASHNDWERAMASMKGDVDELDQLVDELLTYSRLKNADPAVSTREVMLDPWLYRITRDINLVNDKVEVTGRIDSGLETIAIDSRLMTRALNNLIRNAVRYARSNVTVTARRSANGAQLVVEDDGDGIANEDLERVFEPFVRVGNSRNGESTGYGLGLAIVKRICEWHGAAVSATSSAMGGAKFVIEFGA